LINHNNRRKAVAGDN